MTSARFYVGDPNAPKPNRGIRIGVSALIRQGDALLLEHRADSDRWSLIGGAIDLGDSIADALVREVWEETGLTVTGYQLFGTFSDPSRILAYPDGNVWRNINLAFLVDVADPTALRVSGESRELRWLTADQWKRLPVAETHREILQRYPSVQIPIIA